MAQTMDFTLGRYEDGTLSVTLVPATPITNRSIQFTLNKRAGGDSNLIVKSCASGFNGVSGISITSPTKGQFNVTINSVDTSGLDPMAYYYGIELLDTPRKKAVDGYLLLDPSVGG